MINNIKFTLKYIYILVLLILLAIYANFKPYYDFNDLIIYFLVILFLTIFFMIKGEPEDNLRGQWLKHSNIFLIGYFIVHFQFYLDLILGFQGIDNNLFVDNNLIIIKAMLVSLIGLICFYMGYSISILIKRSKTEKPIFQQSTIFLQILSILALFYYYLNVNPLYLNGGYGIFEVGAEARYAAIAFTATIYAVVIQRIRNTLAKNIIPKNILEYVKIIGPSTLLVVFIYILGVLFSGDRGPIITFSLLYMGGYLMLTKKKIKIIYILLLLVLAGTFFSILGEARQMRDQGSFWHKITSVYDSDNNKENDSLIPATRELSISVSALHHIVDYLPAQNNYLFGKLQLNEFMLSIPLGGVIFSYTESVENRKFVNVQNYITWIAQGDNPSYGNGGTVVADFYSIFGIISVIYGMFILGWFIRALEFRMFVAPSQSLIWQTLFIIYFCEILYLSRSSILGSLKTIMLVALLLYLNRIIFYRRLN